MAEVDTIDVLDKDSAARTVATISKLLKTAGLPTDAKASTTDATSITMMQVLKQLSAELQLLRTAIGSTALDLGVGTSGVRTLRFAIDSSQAATPGQAAMAASTPVVVASDQSTLPVGGNVAHDAVDSGNPTKVGGKAVSSEPAAVSAADRTNFITDLVGKLITLPYANPENFVSGAITSAMTGTTSTSLIAAPASGLRNYITQITVSNAHATVGTDIIIQDGSGGTTLYTIPAAAVYGGAVITFPTPLRQPTTVTALFCANVTTGASTKVSASGYKGA
jgi:hypothetical protein